MFSRYISTGGSTRLFFIGCVKGRLGDMSGVMSIISTCLDWDNLRCSPEVSQQVAVLGCPSLVVSKMRCRTFQGLCQYRLVKTVII